jgi:hypothetical protein
MRKIDIICGIAIAAALIPLVLFVGVYAPVRQSGPTWLGSVSAIGFVLWIVSAIAGLVFARGDRKRRVIYIIVLLLAPLSFLFYAGAAVSS